MTQEQENQLVQALQSLQRTVEMQQARQQHTVKRVRLLYRITYGAFIALVFSMSLMVAVLALHMPDLSAAIGQMNAHFAHITDDMESMRGNMDSMRQNVAAMSAIVRDMDAIYANMDSMNRDVQAMSANVSGMNARMSNMAYNVTDMHQSFLVMDRTITGMRQDVHHMSTPLRMFNSINPMW